MELLLAQRRQRPQVSHLGVIGTQRQTNAGQLHTFAARCYVVGVCVFFLLFYNLENNFVIHSVIRFMSGKLLKPVVAATWQSIGDMIVILSKVLTDSSRTYLMQKM